MTNPQAIITVTHGAKDYNLDFTSFDVILRENAVSNLEIILNNYQNENFIGKCELGDNIKVQFRYVDETNTYTQLFGGWIDQMEPSLMSHGELMKILSYGYEVGLVNMLVKQQYGSESENPSLNTVQEVLTDAGLGIIPKYVAKVMASATDSGYSLNTSKVANVTSDFRYLYFPGKPALKCLEDIITLVCAANLPNAGCHWIVIPEETTAYLCVATVGNHENPPSDIWPTYWNTTQAASTLEVGEHMVTSAFRKKRSEGNYVLYVGSFRRPADGDKWTENNSGLWGCTAGATLSDESTIKKIGSYSLKMASTEGNTAKDVYYPSGKNLALDVTKIGGKNNKPTITFFARRNVEVTSLAFMLYSSAGNNVWRSIDLQTDQWGGYTFNIGPYVDYTGNADPWRKEGTIDWSNLNYILFNAVLANNANTKNLYIDGLSINGVILRAAYDSSKFSGQKCKMLFIRDDIAKDDTLGASDSGEVAKFAKAELYRAVQTPILGQIVIPLKPSIRAGQLAHIHFGKQASGSYRIDKDMRITTVRHHFGMDGALSYLDLTDDVINSVPIKPTDAYHALMQATAPSFYDRARGSVIAKDIDLTQTIFETDYA